MWLVLNDYCGIGCAIFTYFIVVAVYCGFIRIGIWERIQNGDLSAYVHFTIF